MNSQNNHVNNEVVRQEQEKHRLGLSGGMQLRTYKDDSAKKVMAITRKGVAQFEADAKLEDIKTSVDRFKVDKYFNTLSTSIAEVVNNYLQGVKQNDTGNIISTYNELCMYIKTVINWKTLSENDRNMIMAKFNELLPQINELMDVAITEKYTDRKQIEELKNNLVTRNYVPILYVNYAEAIKSKKPDYATRKELSTKLFSLLNEPMLDDALKAQIEDKIEVYDDARNKFVSAKNADRKKFYKGILEKQEKELNVYIDGIFKSIPQIPERGMYDPVSPAISEKELKQREDDIGSYIPKPKRVFEMDTFEKQEYIKPSKQPRNKEKELQKLEEFKQRKYTETYDEEFARENIDDINKRAKEEVESLKQQYDNEISQLNDNLDYEVDKLNQETLRNIDAYSETIKNLELESKDYEAVSKRIQDYKKAKVPQRISTTKDKVKLLGLTTMRDQHKTDLENIKLLKDNTTEINAYNEQISKTEKNYDVDKKYMERQHEKKKKDLYAEFEKRAELLGKNAKKELMANVKYIPEAQMELLKTKKNIGKSIKERDDIRRERNEARNPYRELDRQDRKASEEYYREQKADDRYRRTQEVRERKRELQEEKDRLLREEGEIFGEGKRRGRGIQSVLRNAIRKPFVQKNPAQDDPSVDLYPQYDFSKYDIKRK